MISPRQFKINANSKLSEVVNTQGLLICGLIIPGTQLTNTSVNFRAGVSDTLLYPVYDNAGNRLAYTVGSNRIVPLDPWMFASCSRFQLEFSLNEAAAREFYLMLGE